MLQRNLIALAVCSALMSGCASTFMSDIDAGVKKADESATRAVASIQAANPTIEKAPDVLVHKMDKSWIPMAKVAEPDYRNNPVLNRHVVVNRRFNSISEATSYITSLTGVPVEIAGNIQQGTAALQAATMVPQPGMPAQTQPQPPVFTYSGKLTGLLDIVASKFNVYWEPEGGGIRFFKTKSRTFRIAALPGDASMTSTVGTQTTGGGSSNGASSNATSEHRSGIQFSGLSIWKGVEDNIKAMLTQDGRVVVTPSTGTLTVDDTPPTLVRVAKFVEEQNIALTRQVVLNVRVLSVELKSTQEYGVNWDAIYQNLGRNLGFKLTSAAPVAVGATGITFSVIGTGSMWDGTKVMLDALSKQGKVSQITSASMVTINNQPAPIQVGRQKSYLASSTTTIGTGGAGNTTTLTPGVVTTGFSMSMLPHILDSGRIMLQYSGDISSLLDLVTVTSGDSSIQTPEVDTRNFLQRVMMNNGETLVLTGFEQFNLTGNKQGVGSADNLALGGAFKTENIKNVLVVLIQPIVTVGMP